MTHVLEILRANPQLFFALGLGVFVFLPAAFTLFNVGEQR